MGSTTNILAINFRRFTLTLVVTVTVIWLLVTFSRAIVAQTPGNLAQRARLEVSKITGIPADRLTIVNEAALADTGITRFKLTDAEGKIYGTSLDTAGNSVSQEALGQAIQAFNNKGFVGKLEAELANKLTQSNSPIKVIFWLKEEAVAPSRGKTVTERQANLNTLKSRYAAIQQPLVDQLKANNQEVIYQSLYAPIVGAAVTPSVIQAMVARSDVERIYLSQVGIPRLNVSRVVVQANTVNSRGNTGVSERVGILEPDRIGTHPNLPSNSRILCRPTASTLISNHKTQVAGAIQSTNATNRGIAPNITIVDGIVVDYSDLELMAGLDCLISTVSATNMSFGFETNGTFNTFARYVDQTVYETGATTVVAVSDFCANKMGSPEIAFNAIAVGSFGDNNTTATIDDIVPCNNGILGSYLDPDSPQGDREEPDIVAPGDNIMTTLNGGGFANASGTSFAAPHVSSGVGLLNETKSDLFSKPEEVRSIMMASARHNLEGDSRLSERDGAGGILLAAADTVAATSGLSDTFINNGAASNFPISRTFTATNGQKVRVAIAWAHKMPLGNTMTQPTTDLDLQVFCGSTSLGISSSYDNNYEIVEFTATSCPTSYTAKISNFRSSSGDEHIGFAVSKTDT